MFKSKFFKQLLGSLVVAGIVVIGWIVTKSLFGGRDDDFYQSVWGFGLTPFGIAVTVLIVVVAVIISRLTNKSDKRIEKEFADYMARKKKDKP